MNGYVEDCRIVAVGCVLKSSSDWSNAENDLRGQRAGNTEFSRAGEAAAAEAETIDDARGSAPYKTDLLRVHVRRALQAAANAGAR